MTIFQVSQGLSRAVADDLRTGCWCYTHVLFRVLFAAFAGAATYGDARCYIPEPFVGAVFPSPPPVCILTATLVLLSSSEEFRKVESPV